MNDYQRGIWVAVFLGIFTIVEYVFAVEVSSDVIRFAGLAVAAVVKSWLIIQYFMHIARSWKQEGAH